MLDPASACESLFYPAAVQTLFDSVFEDPGNIFKPAPNVVKNDLLGFSKTVRDLSYRKAACDLNVMTCLTLHRYLRHTWLCLLRDNFHKCQRKPSELALPIQILCKRNQTLRLWAFCGAELLRQTPALTRTAAFSAVYFIDICTGCRTVSSSSPLDSHERLWRRTWLHM